MTTTSKIQAKIEVNAADEGTKVEKIIPQGQPTPIEHTSKALTPEEVQKYKAMYTGIRKKWVDMARIVPDLKEQNFNPPTDRNVLVTYLSDFGKYMAALLSEINQEHEAQGSVIEASLLSIADTEDYAILTDRINSIVEMFDTYKPDFEKIAKNAELDKRNSRPFTTETLNSASNLLDKMADLIAKNKDSISKDLEPTVDPNKTVIMHSSKQEVTSIVKLLVDAANRLDLRPPTQKSKEQLAELLSYMKALRECYQAMHWVSRGEPYYGDHQLFSRLYESLAEEVDGLAEKAIGYTDDAYIVEVQYQTARVATHVSEIMSFLPDMTNIQCMLNAEKKLSKEIVPKILNSLEQAGELSDGLENFLQGIADGHEQNIYHLQRRLKTKKDLSELGPVEPNISPPPEPTPEVDNEFDTMVEDENIV